MTEDITIKRKMLTEQQRHEFNMELLRWLTSRHGTYLMMIAGGTGFAYIVRLMSGEEIPEAETKSWMDNLVKGMQEAFKAAAPMAGIAGMLAYATATGDKNVAYEWTGAGIATIGATCLILDAMAGSNSTQSPLSAIQKVI